MPADKQPSREQVIAQVVAELEVHRTIFGQSNLGNGAYALIQYLPGGDLIFNSIGGPLRVPLG